MKIVVLHGSTLAEKNELLYTYVKDVCKKDEVYNLGAFQSDTSNYSYLETALCIGFLLNSNACDYVVTGCSSGMGMMLACNAMPNVLCGYSATPKEAFLYGSIINGNAISFPLGNEYGYQGDKNLKRCIEQLFQCEMGFGFPASQADRKQKDAKLLKELKAQSQVSFSTYVKTLDPAFLCSSLKRDAFYNFIKAHGTDSDLMDLLDQYQC